MDAFTPQQTIELISRTGAKKAKMRLDKLWWNSFMAGPLLGFGCAITLSTNAAPWYQENAPGLIRTIAAMFFPVGLVLVVLTGADLYTSNVMFLPVAFLHRRVSLFDVGKSWFVSYFGNLAGMLFFMALINGYGGVFGADAFKEESIAFAMKKVAPEWHQIFLKAIGANWLVCLAVFMAMSSREVISKIAAIWWPITTFVGLGMDHVIANMFLIPMGMFNGAPISTGYYIWKSMIPAWLGNTIGGGLFVGGVYFYLYLTGEGSEVAVDFNLSNVNTAIDEAGGPMGRRCEKCGHGPIGSSGDIDSTSDKEYPPTKLPDSGGHFKSAVGSELKQPKQDVSQHEHVHV